MKNISRDCDDGNSKVIIDFTKLKDKLSEPIWNSVYETYDVNECYEKFNKILYCKLECIKAKTNTNITK